MSAKFSKSLTWALRHGIDSLGISMRPDGYVLLEELLACDRFSGKTLEQVQEVVASDKKGRFSLIEEDGVWLLRANQGHSVQHVRQEEMYTRITDASDAPVCVHGTYYKRLPSICENGLNRMQRTHIHFAADHPRNKVLSGMRGNVEVAIYLDVQKALDAGIELYRSENGVLLTEGFDGIVPPAFFERIIDVQAGTLLSVEEYASKNGDVVSKVGSSTDSSSPKPLFDYLVVLDFEATCIENGTIPNQEIIEFPSILLDLNTMEVVDEFHSYVKPTANPTLSEFCTSLTGIEQETVDAAPEFAEVFQQHQAWLVSHGISLTNPFEKESSDDTGKEMDEEERKESSSAKDMDIEDSLDATKTAVIVTHGDWDLKTCLPAQCHLLNLPIPAVYRSWCNIKVIVRESYRHSDGRPLNRRAKLGMERVLDLLGLPLDGRHHSGIDDSRNITKCAVSLIREYHASFHITYPR